MPAARQISVVVDADSAPLQAAVDKAAVSLNELGKTLAGQTDKALAGAKKTIASNQDVASSYERTSGTVRGSVLQVVESIQTQVAEQQRAAGAAKESAAVQERAAASVAETQAVGAGKANAAANEQVAAQKRISDAAVRSSAAQTKAFGASGSTLVGWGKKVMLAATGIAGASVYMAAKFEESTLRLRTQAGATQGEMDKLRKGMLDMAGSVGQTPLELEKGMYHVVSSMGALLPKATRVREELQVLKVASEGAAVGGTNLEETSYALASAMNALHLKAGDAEKAMGTLNAIVGAGDMTMSDLLDSLKSGVLPTAQAFGTSLESVGAALAVFGDEGIRGSEAGTKLRMMFALLGGPTGKSVEILKAIGVSAGDMKTKFAGMQTALESAGVSTTRMSEDLKKPNGLYVALTDLKQHLEASGLSATASAAVISRAFGGGRTGAGIMMLVQNLERLHVKYDQTTTKTKEFHSAWEQTQKTLAFEAKQLGAEAEALGIKFGSKLVPEVRSAIGTFKEIAHWFHEGSTEAKVLEGVIAGGLSLAVGAFTVNKLGKMLNGLREAAGLLGLTAGRAGAASAAGVAGTAGAGKAGEAAAAGAAGFGTRLIRGGVLAGVGVAGAQLAGQAVGGKAGHDISSIGSGAAIGAGIGTVIAPGLGTAIGAGLGSVPGIVKALEGGTQGAHILEHGAKGTNAGVPLGRNIDAANKVAEKAIYAIQHQHQEFSDGLAHWLHDHTAGIVANPPSEHGGATRRKEREDVERQKNAALFSAGHQFGGEHFKETTAATAGFGWQAKVTAIITDMEKRFSDPNLPNAAKAGAFAAIMAMVKTYQEKGKLPPTAVEEITRTIEGKFPALKQAFSHAGADSVTALNNALKGQHTLTGLEGLVSSWRNIFPQLPKIAGLNMGNAQHEIERVNATLATLAHTGPESQRAAYAEIYKKVRDEEIRYFHEMRGGITGEIKKLTTELHHHAPGVVAPLEQAFNRMVNVIRAEMGAGVKAVSVGTREINQVLTKELSALGIKAPSLKNQSFGPMPGGGANPLQQTGVGESSGFTGLAQGGLVQLGKPGDAGRDSIPMNVGGANIVAAPGEQVAVFTRHQQEVANAALAPMGGLPGLFRNVSKPHYMAQGGFAGYSLPLPRSSMMPGAWSIDQGVDIPAAAGTPEYAIGPGTITGEGISGFGPNAPILRISSGPLAGRNIYYGHAGPDLVRTGATVSAGQQITEVGAGIVGKSTGPHIEIGFGPPFGSGAPMADLLRQLLGGAGVSGVTSVAGAGLGAVATATQAIAQAIKAPHVHGTGAIAQIAQGALNKVAGAANQKLGTASASSFAGVPGHGGSHAANESLGKQMMLAAGWPAAQWPALQALWTQESGWDANSVNPSSGAYGIPQALGHGHPFNLGDARGQIAWGLNYIKGRYGSPGAAEAHERAFNWYEHGGIVNAAAGVMATAKKAKLPPAPKHMKVKGGKTPSGGLAGLIHSLGGVPDTENVRALQGFPPLLAQLSTEQTLLSKLEGLPNRSFIAQGDLATIGPLAGLHAGMTTTEARGLKPSSFQEEVLSWIGELPSHRLLTGGDVALLHPPGTGFLKAGLPMASAAENVLVQQTEANEALVHAEKQVKAIWQGLVKQYKERQERIMAHEEKEDTRLHHIKEHIARLTTGQLKSRVAAAQNRDHHNALIGDARASEQAIAENIAGERSLPSKSQDKKLIAKWEADKRHLAGYIGGLSKPASQTGAALVNLRKNELKAEEVPLEEQLNTLGGKRTGIGTGGQYGKVAGYVKTLNTGVTSISEKITEGEQSTIPGLKIELEQQQQENRAANLRPAPTSSATGEGNAGLLDSLNKQLIQQLSETVTLQGVQLSTFQNFIPQIPKYEKGGPVVNDGLIYAHKGEHVVPVGGSLAVNSSAPNVQTNVHVHGELAPLLRIIDERVAHPDNVRVVSQHVARRTTLLGRGR